jgi:hypothetical protein
MSFYHNGSTYARFTNGGLGTHPTEYTIACWVKLPNASNNHSFCVRSNGDPGGSWTHQLKSATNRFQHYTYDGSSKSVTSNVYVANRWYHVAGTAKNGGFIRLYVNGQQEGTPALCATLWAGGNDFWTGVYTGGASVTSLTGEMTEFCLWYKELTANEILTISSKVRYAPLQVHYNSIYLYLPMNDLSDGTNVSSNYKDLSRFSNTQSRTGTPVCRADEISYQ